MTNRIRTIVSQNPPVLNQHEPSPEEVPPTRQSIPSVASPRANNDPCFLTVGYAEPGRSNSHPQPANYSNSQRQTPIETRADGEIPDATVTTMSHEKTKDPVQANQGGP